MGVVDRVIATSVPAIPRPVVRRISGRYIAGERLEDAVSAIRALNAEGCAATVDLLGETTLDPGEAAKKLAAYERIVDALDREGLDSGISVKLTGLGLRFDRELARRNLEEIVAHAEARGRFVRVDMEDSPHTDDTLRLVHDLRERYENVGAVLQAYLRRSIKDAESLVAAGITARLCKGIYDEPRELAYKDFDTVRENYVALMERFLRGGVYVGIATHDEYLVWHALRLIHELEVPRDRYEFQMLLGVDEQLRRILLDEGHRVRIYVPFGEDWYEYSTRRLKENPRIAGYVAKDVLGRLAGQVKK